LFGGSRDFSKDAIAGSVSQANKGTRLLNRFEFEIPNPLVSWGFNTFAASWTQNDMKAQLRRLKRVAEETYQE
jgi:hypothetical protein